MCIADKIAVLERQLTKLRTAQLIIAGEETIQDDLGQRQQTKCEADSQAPHSPPSATTKRAMVAMIRSMGTNAALPILTEHWEHAELRRGFHTLRSGASSDLTRDPISGTSTASVTQATAARVKELTGQGRLTQASAMLLECWQQNIGSGAVESQCHSNHTPAAKRHALIVDPCIANTQTSGGRLPLLQKPTTQGTSESKQRPKPLQADLVGAEFKRPYGKRENLRPCRPLGLHPNSNRRVEASARAVRHSGSQHRTWVRDHCILRIC